MNGLFLLSMTMIGLSVAGGVILVAWLFRQKENLQNEEWLDRPPWLFRLCRPFIRLFAHRVREQMLAKHPARYEWMQDRLAAAGLGYCIQPEEWQVLRRILLIVGLLISTAMFARGGGLLFNVLAIGVVPLAYFYPDLFIRDRVRKCVSQIEKEFPFFLELLVLTLRAGMNFPAALNETVRRLDSGPVRDEFERVLREVRAGKARRTALLDLSRRQNIPAINMFVATVNQAEETGGEMSTVLNVQAEERRFERFNRAEIKANQAPVKMLLPLLGGLFPITFLLIVFLVIIKLRESGSLSSLF